LPLAVLLLSFRSAAEESAVAVAALALAVAFEVAVVLAVLVVIPEGDLLSPDLIASLKTCQVPKPPNSPITSNIQVAY
jgi:hypothetical protein